MQQNRNKNNRTTSNSKIWNYKEVSTFLQEVYMNCKNFGIEPVIVFLWIKDLFNCYLPFDNSSPSLGQVPFISQISNFITQKKKQCIDLENDKKEIYKDVKIAESKRNEIQFDLEGLKQENNYVMSFMDWYYELKKNYGKIFY